MNLEAFGLSGKTALVTGCNRGIGKACALALAAAGADIVGVSRSGDFEKTAGAVQELGQSFTGYSCDFSSRTALHAFIQAVKADFPGSIFWSIMPAPFYANRQ